MQNNRHDIVLASLIAVFICVTLWTVFAVDLPLLALGMTGDAGGYDLGAMFLAEKGMYTMDGVHLQFDREMGYFLFVAAVYVLFGVHNYLAVFAVQLLIFLLAILVFERSLRAWTSDAISLLTVGILFLLPSVYLQPELLLRESLLMSLLLFFTAFFLDTLRSPSWLSAVLAGFFLGLGIFTNTALFFLPLFLLFIIPFWKGSARYLFVILVCAYAVFSPWPLRNMMLIGKPCIVGCYRDALQWYVRGERSEHLRGLEPYRCLWSEYVSRDWTDRSAYCNFNAVWHKKWPEGFTSIPENLAIASAGKAKIRLHFPAYVWDSISEVLEFHLPYVGPWGRTYNMLESVATLFLYLGCLCAIPKLFSRKMLPFSVLAFYFVSLFALTDAIPRYRMPVIFCYAVLSAIGYHRILVFFRLCPKSVSSFRHSMKREPLVSS